MYPQKDFVDAGGLMSYGPSNPDMRRRAAVYVEPHFHPDDRITTVISGTIHVGYGEQFDESKMKALPAGSVWTEPANQPHFAWAKDGEVVLQVVGNGPSGTTPVRPRQ